jgi:hypothetical protein
MSKTPATPPPPSPSPPAPTRPPTKPPRKAIADDVFDLAASLGFQDLGLRPQGVRPHVAADSEGRTGGAAIVPGAVPFTLPPTRPVPSFDNSPAVS